MKIVTVIYLLLVSFSGFAVPPPGLWECMAFDAREKSYEAVAETRTQAMEAAKSLCQRSSKQNCKVAQNFCTQGPDSVNDNRCIASDGAGHAFNGTGFNACEKALASCNEWQFQNGNNSSGGQCFISHRDNDDDL
jgi:hypothetical protein